MTKILLPFLFFAAACQAPVPTKSTIDPDPAQVWLDSLSLDQLGADEYGMKPYVMAYLKRGPNRDFSEEEAQALQKAHLDNIGRLVESGEMLIAGPFLDDGDVRGIFIFDVPTLEEAERLTQSDPAVQAGSLEMELRPWYGPAVLSSLVDLNRHLEAKKEAQQATLSPKADR